MNRPLVLFLLLLLSNGCALRSYTQAAQKGRTTHLVKGLHHKHGYIRELAANGLRVASPDDASTASLRACLASPTERGYVRAACARTLAAWHVDDAAPAMISAMNEVDPESRYWIAEALHRLGTDEARAHLKSLCNDPDLFLATSAREWSR